MKKILFVEDQPTYKLGALLQYLKMKKVDVEYEILGSVTEALRYLRNKNNKVDLVVTDLGLPIFKEEMVNNLLTGMDIVNYMDMFNTVAPVIINSTTVVPNFDYVKEDYDLRGQQLYKVDNIMEMKDWILEFLQN